MKWGLAAIAVLAVTCAGSARGGSSPWSDVALVWTHGSRDGAVWGMRADGRGERPVDVQVKSADVTAAYSWSPGGTDFAFGDGHGVVVIDTATGERRRVPGASAPPCDSHVSLGLAGRLLCDDGESGHLWIVDRGRASELEDGPLSLAGATWGPRGELAAAYSTGDLAVFKLSPFRQVASVAGSGHDPAWAPDGRTIAFDATDNAEDSTMFIWIGGVGAANGSARRLARGAHPSFSPDGRWIAFDRGGEIFVMRADGTDVHQLTHRRGPDLMPLWRPR